MKYCRKNKKYPSIDQLGNIIAQNTINTSRGTQTPHITSTLTYQLTLLPSKN